MRLLTLLRFSRRASGMEARSSVMPKSCARPQRLWPLHWKSEAKLHEATFLFLVLVCIDELCGRGRSVPLPHWEERSVVERQLYASAPEISVANLTVRCIENLDEFIAIEREWQTLVDHSGVDPVFLSHAWLRTWWECFGPNEQFRIVLVW